MKLISNIFFFNLVTIQISSRNKDISAIVSTRDKSGPQNLSLILSILKSFILAENRSIVSPRPQLNDTWNNYDHIRPARYLGETLTKKSEWYTNSFRFLPQKCMKWLPRILADMSLEVLGFLPAFLKVIWQKSNEKGVGKSDVLDAILIVF